MTTASEIDDMVTNPAATPQGDNTFFGEVVTLDYSAWKLVKGQGRVLFDATYDDPADRVRGIQIAVECQKRDGGTYTIDTGKQPLLEIDTAWRKHLLPSIQRLNVPLSTLRGKFVQVKRVETGETYVNKTTNETKNKTALVLVAVYDSADAMQAGRDAKYGRSGQASSTPAQPSAPAAPATVDKTALEKLLPALWAASGRNEVVFTTMFEANPALKSAFTLDEAIAAASLPF